MDSLLERNLRKLKPAWRKSVHHVPHDELLAMIASDFPGFAQSSRAFELETPFLAPDMAWNHMDFSHRPWVHHHYEDGLRFAIGNDVCMGVTPMGFLPFLVPTFDLRVSDREFRQFYTIGGLFSIFMRISIVDRGEGNNNWRVEWTIVSKWYLKPFQYALHFAIERLNRKLYGEDLPVKAQRRKLREAGYEFNNDDPDYLESTRLYPPNVKRPPAAELSVRLNELAVGSRKSLKSGPREFLVEKRGSGEVWVWDAICAHQGAHLGAAKACGKALECPWHGLKVGALELSVAKPNGRGDGFTARLESDELRISPA